MMHELADVVGSIFWFASMLLVFAAVGIYSGYVTLALVPLTLGLLLLALTMFTVGWMGLCYLRTHRRA